MTTDDPGSRGFSLTRWSQRKLEAARSASAPGPEAAAAPETSAPPASAPSPATPSAVAPESTPAAALPPIESLTIDSDFSVFLGPRVDPAVKLGALKKLFRDPRFNVMDGLDVYIDDYSKPDPLPEGWLEKMTQVARLGVFQPKDEGEQPPEAQVQGGADGTAAAVPLSKPEPALPVDSAATSNVSSDAPPVGESPLREG